MLFVRAMLNPFLSTLFDIVFPGSNKTLITYFNWAIKEQLDPINTLSPIVVLFLFVIVTSNNLLCYISPIIVSPIYAKGLFLYNYQF